MFYLFCHALTFFFFFLLQREEIRFMLERDGSAKGIVFSQFTSFLDLINYSLTKVSCSKHVESSYSQRKLVVLYHAMNPLQSGITCVQLIGSMSLPQRDDAIKRFIDDPDCKIFLMSLKAGGIALNLTVASHVRSHFRLTMQFNYSHVMTLIMLHICCYHTVCTNMFLLIKLIVFVFGDEYALFSFFDLHFRCSSWTLGGILLWNDKHKTESTELDNISLSGAVF